MAKEQEPLEETLNDIDENIETANAAENNENEPIIDGTEETPKEKMVEEIIAELETKLEESDNSYLRLRADFDNFRRRTKLDHEAIEKYGSQKLITGLLPAIDNFDRAMQIEPDNEQTKTLLQGMEMIYRDLMKALSDEGAEPIETVGKEFDPNFHQAVMQVEDPNFAANTVVEEFQKGFKLKDRVIRAAMVKVNQ